jgi:hypothetical protein
MRFDEFVEPNRADKLDVQLDRRMRLAVGGALRRHAHGLVGKRGEHAAVHDIDKVQMLFLDHKAEMSVAALLQAAPPMLQIQSDRPFSSPFRLKTLGSYRSMELSALSRFVSLGAYFRLFLPISVDTVSQSDT